MEQQGNRHSQGGQQERKDVVTVAAPKDEWKDVESLITSYRQQCKAMKHFPSKMERLTRFQRRPTQATGGKSPDDYFI